MKIFPKKITPFLSYVIFMSIVFGILFLGLSLMIGLTSLDSDLAMENFERIHLQSTKSAEGHIEYDGAQFDRYLELLEMSQTRRFGIAQMDLNLSWARQIWYDLGDENLEISEADRARIANQAHPALTQMVGEDHGWDAASWRQWQKNRNSNQSPIVISKC